MLNPTVQCFPCNNDNEDNAMITNSSGLGQDKARTLNSSHCNPEDLKTKHRDENGVVKLNTKAGCNTYAQSSELAKSKP
jgi:hypothetical protein